jgi:hypothetical protein
MRYNTPINLKLYKYTNAQFILQAIIDDYQEISFAHNLYEAGDFTITINYNIPNALKFERGMFVQFGNDPYMFGEILTINDAIGSDGKGSQIRTITGKDTRYLFKRRIIKNLNNVENWAMTDKGELCLRNLVKDQCGSGAEAKRQLPITNTIPQSADAIGKEYSVAESFSNLYDTLVTIATQSEIGWRVKFDGALTLEVYQGSDISTSVQFSTNFDSLSNGEFTDSAESFANTIYVGGKGTGNDRDIYEGESAIEGESPSGLERFEAWDNQSGMTTESEYEAEALSMLNQYGKTINVSGNGLAQCPYIFKENYNIGDTITLAFSGKSAKAQILSVTEHWTWGQYGIEFSFGKPQNDLSRQLQLILKQIQKASNKTKTTESVKYYTIPTDTIQPSADVVYDRIGFTGTCAENGSTFQLYLDNEKTGAKTYHVYIKQLGGGNLTLTTGKEGATDLVLNSGTYVAIIYIDAEGNISSSGATATSVIESGNNQPATSDGVAGAIQNVTDIASSLPTDAVLHYSFDDVPDYPDGTADVRLLIGTFDLQSMTQAFVDNGGSTLTNNSGDLQIAVATAQTNGGAYIPNTSIKNKVVKMKIEVSALGGDVTIRNGIDTTVLTITKTGTYEVSLYGNSLTTANNGLLIISDSTFTAIARAIYIGNGSYTTPIIDNANGQNNATNNGGLSIQGVCGKGLLCLENKYVNCGNYHFSNDFSIAVWVNPQNVTSGITGNIFAKTGVLILRNGAVNNDYLQLYGYFKNGNTFNTGNAYGNLLPIGWTHLVVTKEGTTLKFYNNGVLVDDRILESTDLVDNDNLLSIARSTNSRSQSYDDFQIFNRVLSEKEVQALYHNKANTPKYYDINNYNLKQIKDITAQSTDFADFQSRMAGLATRSLQLIEPTEDER